jgi:hypothetical protein
VRIGTIVKEQQPEVHAKLNKRKLKRKRRRRNKEHFSFSSIDRMMRERTDVDESKCRGR